MMIKDIKNGIVVLSALEELGNIDYGKEDLETLEIIKSMRESLYQLVSELIKTAQCEMEELQ